MSPEQIEAWIQKPLENAFFLTGPTASGKSDVALEVADNLGAEIISVDSMAVYRGMDIGTAKPSAEAQQRVPHHLIDLVDPTIDYSVSQFVMDAHRLAHEIQSRGRRVLLVGGTPLYLKSLLCGMFQGPPADWEFRGAVQADIEAYGLDALRRRLYQVDPLSAHKILPGDSRRMIRALEVAKITGSPLSHWQTQFERFSIPKSSRAIVLAWDRHSLHQRVEQRVDRMFERGLLDEVRRLTSKYGRLGRTASQAVGYKEPMEYLAGKLPEKEMVDQVKAHTRQFVRRQEIWFRSMPGMTRIPISSEQDLDAATRAIALALEDRQVA
ncbi:MAG: tRNA (adenosine(37)-N6)-dimethylallyltransferase MiaA [Planctomycetes bacterium]|nr:tRNA (adenosine(37)-N6)-dimethylallyltransferase MiaA [Planctomycetota bacterium]